MPPNRGDDDRGFMVWETDGKKSVQHQICVAFLDRLPRCVGRGLDATLPRFLP